MILSLLSLELTYFCAKDLEVQSSSLIMATLNISFELAIVFQLIVVSVYWTIVHETVLIEVKGNTHALIQTYCSHSIPFLATMINFFITDIVFKLSHVKYLCPVGLFYLLTNYLTTLYRGHPVYFFLPWDSINSVYICSIPRTSRYYVLCQLH